VEYSDKFPWPKGADALGAGDRWTGIDPMRHQYRGISLERVSGGAPGGCPVKLAGVATGGRPQPRTAQCGCVAQAVAGRRKPDHHGIGRRLDTGDG